jgi:hypothetical protein
MTAGAKGNMTKDQFMQLCETSPNGVRLKSEFVAQETARLAAIPDLPVYDKVERAQERDLQAQCEGWLSNRGYRRLTAPEASRAAKESMSEQVGWFFHMHKPIGNPLMPDLVVFNADMSRSLCVELKVRPLYQPGQKEMIGLGCWRMAQWFQEFEGFVREWEDEVEK